MDPEKLLLRISSGEPLTQSEKKEIVELLESFHNAGQTRGLSLDEAYSFLLVIGRSHVYEYRPLIEKFLDCRDPLTVALVLEILCLEWRETAQYLERILHFALGAVWDDEDDVRHTALKILGEYLFSVYGDNKQHEKFSVSGEKEKQVLELLLSIFSDNEAETWTRHVAYRALCRAYGKDWEQIPSECQQLDFRPESREIDWKMIEQIKTASTIQPSLF